LFAEFSGVKPSEFCFPLSEVTNSLIAARIDVFTVVVKPERSPLVFPDILDFTVLNSVAILVARSETRVDKLAMTIYIN
jgi:hypothetical protein